MSEDHVVEHDGGGGMMMVMMVHESRHDHGGRGGRGHAAGEGGG